jgi:metal-dependent amidase/aminoacylase/carboxypeptidase family protein
MKVKLVLLALGVLLSLLAAKSTRPRVSASSSTASVDTSRLEGTMRTPNDDLRKRAQGLMREALDGVTRANGASFELQFEEGAALTYNEPSLVEETRPVMRRIVGASNVVTLKPQMGAEDFAYYQRVVPGFYYFLGVCHRAKGITAQIHTPAFDVDEESLVIGVKVMANVLLDYLDRHAAR